jgi:hypothetical protein
MPSFMNSIKLVRLSLIFCLVNKAMKYWQTSLISEDN